MKELAFDDYVPASTLTARWAESLMPDGSPAAQVLTRGPEVTHLVRYDRSDVERLVSWLQAWLGEHPEAVADDDERVMGLPNPEIPKSYVDAVRPWTGFQLSFALRSLADSGTVRYIDQATLMESARRLVGRPAPSQASEGEKSEDASWALLVDGAKRDRLAERRDRFAAAALQGLIAADYSLDVDSEIATEKGFAARECVRYADRLIAELDQ